MHIFIYENIKNSSLCQELTCAQMAKMDCNQCFQILSICTEKWLPRKLLVGFPLRKKLFDVFLLVCCSKSSFMFEQRHFDKQLCRTVLSKIQQHSCDKQ